MRPHLFIHLLLLLLATSAGAQTYYSITHTSGTVTIGGNGVTVNQLNGPCTTGGQCSVTGYLIGNGANNGYRFIFSNRAADIRIKIYGLNVGEELSIGVNGTFYPLGPGNISANPGPCMASTTNVIQGGKLTSNAPTTNSGDNAQIDFNPGMPIDSIDVFETIPASGGSVFQIEFTNDTCGNYTLTTTSNNPCEGDTLKLFASTVTGVTDYSWYFNSVKVSNSQNYFIPSAHQSEAGQYIAIGQRGACNYGSFITANVKPLPVVSGTTSNAPVCPGQTLNLSTDAVAGATYSWTGPVAFTSTLQNPSIPNVSFNRQGWYYARAIKNGCTSLPDSTLVTLTSSVPSPTSTTSNSPVCPGNPLTISADPVPGATSYVWVGPNSFSTTTSTPTVTVNNVTFADSGKYYIAAVVSGCQSLPDSTAAVVAILTPTPVSDDTITACPKTTLILNVAQTPGATYTWTGPNSFNATGPNPFINNIDNSNGGRYYVTATINNCTSLPDSTQVVIAITTPTPDADSAITVCPGTVMNLNVGSMPSAAYSWTGPAFGTPSQVQNPAVPNTVYAFAGKYYVTATINGCTSLPDSTIVTVDITTPTPKASSNTPVCPGTTIKLESSDIPGATYSWTGPALFTSSNQKPSIPTVSNSNSGTYYLRATLNGCVSNPDSIKVSVEITTPTPDANYNGPVCEGDSIQLTAAPIANADFSWTGPNSYTNNAQNPVIKNAVPGLTGLYIVRANVDGCISLPDTVQVTVKKAPVVSIIGDKVICEGDTLRLASQTEQAQSYSWTGPNNFTSAEQNIIRPGVSKEAEGTYTLVTSNDGCYTLAPARFDVKVKPLPVVPVASSNSPSGKDAKKPGDDLEFKGISTTPGVTYTWSGPNGFSANEPNPVIHYITKDAEGTYKLTTTLDGCTTSAETYVMISTNSYYLLYPNPSNGQFTFRASLLYDQKAPVEILNAAGQVIYRDAAEVKGKLLMKTFDVSGFPDGLYFLHIPLKEENWNIRFILSR